MQKNLKLEPVVQPGFIQRAKSWLPIAFLQSRPAIGDVAVSMVPQGVALCTGFFSSVLVARGLGPSGLGEYALVLSLSDIAVTLSDLGIGQTAIRYATRAAGMGDSAGHLAFLRWAFRRRMSLMFVISAAAFFAAPFLSGSVWHDPGLTPWLRVGLLIGGFGALAHVPTVYFQSLRRFHVNASIGTGQALMGFAGILLLAFLKDWSVPSVLSVSVITAACGAFAFIFIVPRAALFAGSFASLWPPNFLARLWRGPQVTVSEHDQNELEHPELFARYMLLSSFCVLLTLKADVWMMGHYLNAASVGIYNAGTRFTVPLATLLAAITTALWPRTSVLVRLEDKVALLRRTFRQCSFLSLGGLAYGIVVPLLAPFLFGSRFAGSVFLGQLLCVRYVIALLTCPVGAVCYSLGFARLYWIINLVQLVAVVATNVILLPRIGPVGSAVALLVNETVGFAAVGALVWSKVGRLIIDGRN